MSAFVLGASVLGVSVLAASVLGAATRARADAPDPVSVPVTLAQTDADNGQYYPTVQITLGSNPDPYTVILDTGSTALVMWAPVDGATATDAPASVTYVGDSVSGVIAVADFSIGGQTASDVDFLAGSCGGCAFGGVEVDGIMGVGQALQTQKSASSDTTYPWFSPLRQFDDATLAAGFTLDFSTTAGTLTLGAPSLAAGAAGVTAIQAAATSASYPTANAFPVYEKAVPLCWTVEEIAPLCQATTIDTGAPTGILTGAQFASLVTPFSSSGSTATPTPAPTLAPETAIGSITHGSTIAYSTSGSTTPFITWVTNYSDDKMNVYNSIPDGHLNTGNSFFLDRTVGYDDATGQILVQTNGTAPAAPATVSTTSSDGVLSALWNDLDLESEPPTDRLVRVRDSSGAVVARIVLPGDATSTDITGLRNGESYTVAVASANRHGVSAYAFADPATPHGASTSPTDAGERLADTGAAVAPWLGIGALSLAAGLAALALRRRRAAR